MTALSERACSLPLNSQSALRNSLCHGKVEVRLIPCPWKWEVFFFLLITTFFRNSQTKASWERHSGIPVIFTRGKLWPQGLWQTHHRSPATPHRSPYSWLWLTWTVCRPPNASSLPRSPSSLGAQLHAPEETDLDISVLSSPCLSKAKVTNL